MKTNIEGVKVNKAITYYVQGHTGKGYVNYIKKNLQQINKIILLKHEEAIVVTLVLKEIMKRYKYENIEIIKSIESNDLIEGVIIRRMSLAILNERIYKGASQNAKSVPIHIDLDNLPSPVEKLSKNNYEKAYKCFAKGLEIHEKLEKLYIAEMDFKKADKIIENLLKELFSNVNPKQDRTTVYERLFGTNTPDGIVNTVPSLIEPINNKIFILGRAGTGKSYLMNKALEKCLELGIDVELYRCSLDPNSIDMLIIRELNVCIHDNTSPHVVSMNYNDIKIIDMYKETVNQSVEKDNETKINHLQNKYKEQMKLGLHYLKKHQVNYRNLSKKLNDIDFTPIIKEIF